MNTYTEIEMLNLYRSALGLSRVLNLPPVSERQPLDRELLAELRQRYLTLLASEEEHLLPVHDVGALASLQLDQNAQSLTIGLPDSCLRPVSLSLNGWRQPVYNFHKVNTPLFRRQKYRWLRASHTAPLVFRSANQLIVYGLPPEFNTQEGCSLRAVAPPADGTFRLHESLVPKLIQ